MKKAKILVCFLAAISILCFYAGCNGCVDNGSFVKGIEDGKVYVLQAGEIAAEFSEGEATLAKDGGVAAPYTSGTVIGSIGEYVLIWTSGDKTETYCFTVKNDETLIPGITGVTDGQITEYGTAIAPVFDKGSATISKNGGAAEAFTSGSQVTEIGKYVLVVTNEGIKVAVNFEIVIPSYKGQMADEFLGESVNGGYVNAEDAILSIENGALRIKDNGKDPGWCLFRREFKGLNLNENPCVEVSILELKNASFKFSVDTTNSMSGEALNVLSYTAGKVYVDLKSYAEKRGLNTESCDLWMQIALEGNQAFSTKLSALIDYYKSVKNIPPEQPVTEPYVDNTAETLTAWVTNTAEFREVGGKVVGLVQNANENEHYGKVMKRVQLNTKKYPYLIIDIDTVVDGWKIEAFEYNDNIYQGDSSKKTLIETSAAGKVEINLQNLYGEDECVDLKLDFYIVGIDVNGEKVFRINGLWTQADPLYAPVISGISEGDVYNVAVHGGLKVFFDKGTATLSKNDGEALPFDKDTVIDSAGEYTLSVLAGATKKTEVNFTVIEKEYPEGTIEDFLTQSRFTIETVGAATFNVEKNGEEYNSTFAKTGNNVAKIFTRIDFDFTKNSVMVLEFGIGEGFDLGSFKFELLDDVAWFSVNKSGSDANAAEEIKDGDTVVGYRLYYKITVAKHTSGDGRTDSWINRKKDNLRVSFMIEGDKATAVALRSIAMAEKYPGESESADDETIAVIGKALDLYDSFAENEYTVEGGGTASYDEERAEFVLSSATSNEVKLGKEYTFNFRDDGLYIVLVFETDGYTPDAGFNLNLLNTNGKWAETTFSYDKFTRAETRVLPDGRIRYTCFVKLGALKEIGGEELFDFSEKTDAKLTVKIAITGGPDRSIYLKSLSQTDMLVIDDFDYFVNAGYTIKGGATASYDSENDEIVLTKPADKDSGTGIEKQYTYNFKDNGKYLVLTFEADSYVPDIGFVFMLQDQSVPNWPKAEFNFEQFTRVITDSLGNGRTRYTCYAEIATLTETGSGSEVIDYSRKTNAQLMTTIIINYGDSVKTVYLKSLAQTDVLPEAQA